MQTVGHVELRDNLSSVVGRVSAGQRIAVTNHNRVEAYLLPPADLGRLTDALRRLADAEDQLERLHSTLPLLIAALRSGVAYPAEAMRGLIGAELPLEWERMNAFQAAFPVEATHDEDGRPLHEFDGEIRHEPITELDEELRYA